MEYLSYTEEVIKQTAPLKEMGLYQNVVKEIFTVLQSMLMTPDESHRSSSIKTVLALLEKLPNDEKSD